MEVFDDQTSSRLLIISCGAHVATATFCRLLSHSSGSFYSLRFRRRGTTRRNTTARRAILICVCACVRTNFLRPNSSCVTDRRPPLLFTPAYRYRTVSIFVFLSLFLALLFIHAMVVPSFCRLFSPLCQCLFRALVCSLATFDPSLLFATKHRFLTISLHLTVRSVGRSVGPRGRLVGHCVFFFLLSSLSTSLLCRRCRHHPSLRSRRDSEEVSS